MANSTNSASVMPGIQNDKADKKPHVITRKYRIKEVKIFAQRPASGAQINSGLIRGETR